MGKREKRTLQDPSANQRKVEHSLRFQSEGTAPARFFLLFSFLPL